MMIFSLLLIHSITLKTDMKKLKEIEPKLRLTDDNTVSYSEFRDKLLKAGYVEK